MIKRVLIFLFCLVGLIAGLAGFIVFSDKGLQISAALVPRLSAGRVHIGHSEGKILGDWRLEKITIHSDQIDIAIDHLACRWQPKLLLKSVFHAADVSVAGVEVILKPQGNDGPSETAESAESFILPEISLPLSFLIGSLGIDQLEVKRLGGESLIVLDSFSARLSGRMDLLELSDVQFRSSIAGATLTGTAAGNLRMSDSWPVEIVSDWQMAVAGCRNLSGRFQVSQSLTDPLADLQLDSPVQVNGAMRVSDLFADTSYNADIKGASVAIGDICDSWPEAVVDFDLQAGGSVDGSEGVMRAQAFIADALPLSAEFEFGVDARMLTIKSGTVDYGGNQVVVSGGLTFGPELSWDGVVAADSFEISEILPLPATNIDTRIYLSGKFADGEVFYNASVGEVAISVAEYDLILEGGLAVNGNLQGLEITSCRFTCGDGAIDLAGSLNWTEGVQWEADIHLESFDPSEIDALPQGSISGSLSSRGYYKDSDLMVETEIESLTGDLSGYKLSGGGNLVYRDQVLTVTGLDISNGANRLSAEGTVDENFDLDFTINAAELERIYPRLSGNLELTGSLKGPRSDPRAHVVVDGSGLLYQDYSVAGVAAEINAALADRAVKGRLQLEGLQASGIIFKNVDLAVDGTLEKHRLSGMVELDRGQLQSQVMGGLGDNGWQADISGTVFEDHQFGTWKQNGSTHVRLSADSAAADNACFDSDSNRICVQAGWEKPDMWSLSLNDLVFSMDSLNRWGLLEQKITGILRASLQVNAKDAVIESGSGNAVIDELRLKIGPNEYYDDLAWTDTTVNFMVEDTNLDGRISTSFVDGSTLNGTIILAGAGDYPAWNSSMPLRGNVDVDVVDLSFLKTLTADFLLPAGSLSGSFAIEGNVGDPSVAGTIDLQDGELRIPLLGIHLREVAGTIEAGLNKLLLELDSMSGEGSLHSTGKFDFGTRQWRGRFNFTGRDCQLLDRRAISLIADPELDLTLDGDGGRLSGKVLVSQALIEVEKIDRSASESSDVMFVDTLSESTAWPFHYNIEVLLGDDVQVTGYGLKGKLNGHLSVASNPGGTTVGRGYLDIVDGSFAVYGSPLRITRGRLSFDGGPVDNPSLDIKASKFINETRFGYDGIEAGVNVTGSADDFVMDLFSVPGMENADILAYLILDRPISSEGAEGSEGVINSAAQAIGLGKGSDLLTGVSAMLPVDDIRVEGSIESQETAVVVGKKLSKELSVSYDYNLFKNAGSFRVRYEFGKGFSVESRNSMESNGVELLYSLER